MIQWWRARSQVSFGVSDGGRLWRILIGFAALGLMFQFVLLLFLARDLRTGSVIREPAPQYHRMPSRPTRDAGVQGITVDDFRAPLRSTPEGR